MELVRKLETKLAELYKAAPVLPKKAKNIIVEYLPYFVLLGGVLQLWAGYQIWRYMDRFSQATDILDSFSRYYTNTGIGLSGFDKSILYLGIVALLVEAVLLLMAFSPLQKKLRKGWELLFLVSVLQVLYAVVAIFMRGYGIGDFIANLIGAAIGFYFLFQIREFYGAKAALPKAEAK